MTARALLGRTLLPLLLGAGLLLSWSLAYSKGAGKRPKKTRCGPPVAGMACIPGGEFLRGSSDGLKDQRPAEKIYVDSFYIDVYEVTFTEYQECAKAGACRPAHPNYSNFSGPKQPMVGVPWFGADEFCHWKGKRLPTEAEWEKAARGTDGRKYPWGEDPATCEKAIIRAVKWEAPDGGPDGEVAEMDNQGSGCGANTTWPVGSRAPNQFGLYDMAGNAWEWVADWYSPSYAECGDPCRIRNPKGPCDGAPECPGHDEKIVRGGSWFWDAEQCTTTFRRAHTPENKPFHHFGFRCAKDALKRHKAVPVK